MFHGQGIHPHPRWVDLAKPREKPKIKLLKVLHTDDEMFHMLESNDSPLQYNS